MTMEVRYVVFAPDEMRSAIIAYVQSQGLAAALNEVTAVDVVGPNEAPTAVVRLQPSLGTKPINVGSPDLVAALLRYCSDRRIPIPKFADKRAELSVNGLTLVMTIDNTRGSPVVGESRIVYGDIANRATQEITTVKGELARAIARAHYAEGLIAAAEARAKAAEATRARVCALLIAVAMVPGLRGRLGRWLVKSPSVGDFARM